MARDVGPIGLTWALRSILGLRRSFRKSSGGLSGVSEMYH